MLWKESRRMGKVEEERGMSVEQKTSDGRR